MILISNDQIDTLVLERIDRFAKHLAIRARSRHPDACNDLSDSVLTGSLTKEIHAARAFGLKMKREIERFSDIALTLGFGFSENVDWASAIFNDPGLSPVTRLGKVEELAAFVVMGR